MIAQHIPIDKHHANINSSWIAMYEKWFCSVLECDLFPMSQQLKNKYN